MRHYCVRCEGLVLPSEEYKVQNPKAMYQSERRPTFWHTSCFYQQFCDDQAYHASVVAAFDRKLGE